MKNRILSEQTLQSLGNYLSQRPWREVNELIVALSQLPIEAEKPESEKPTE